MPKRSKRADKEFIGMKNKPVRIGLLVLLLLALPFAALAAGAAGRDVTFISTSDSHYNYGKNEGINARDLETVRAINAVTDICWPDELGGDRVKAPKGVLLLGDCINDGDMARDGVNVSEKQNEVLLEQLGLDGTDGLLKYPVFEGWGNHDGPPAGKEKNGFSFQAQLKERNKLRKEKGLIKDISESGMQYSWDWDDVHFVNLGIYVADKQREGIRYDPVWHNPQGALTFLKTDLAKNVGDSGRPVVLMAHMGMDTDWWVKDDWADLYNAVNKYNIVAYIYGHSGTGIRDWSPDGKGKKWLMINDGQTESKFFVIQLKGNELRYGLRVKKFIPTKKKTADGKPIDVWNGEWLWQMTGKVAIK